MTPAEEIRQAVFDRYIETGLPSSAPEIAAWLKWSESKVRKVLADNFGAVAGTQADRRSAPKYSKNYPGTVVGASMQWVLLPTMSSLRDALRAATGKPTEN